MKTIHYTLFIYTHTYEDGLTNFFDRKKIKKLFRLVFGFPNSLHKTGSTRH